MTGRLAAGLEPKDIILAIIRKIGTGGATGHVIEYYGPAIAALSMEGRMTICNMSIEAGRRAGLIAPDDTTIEYITRGDRPFAPEGRHSKRRSPTGRRCETDDPSAFDRHVSIDAGALVPQVTWGTNPAMTVDVTGRVPEPEQVPFASPEDARRALEYMGLEPGHADQRDPGRRRLHRLVHERPDRGPASGGPGVQGTKDGRRACRPWSSPAAKQVRHQAEAEGLDRVFLEAGAEWRQAGCSMCLAMNPDKLTPGQRRPAPATATSRAARARAAAPTWSARPWPPPPPSPAISLMSGELLDPEEQSPWNHSSPIAAVWPCSTGATSTPT